MVVRVLAGDQRGSRGAALRGGGDVVGEPGAVAREEALRVRHRAPRQLPVRLVVGLDQDDVGPPDGRGAGYCGCVRQAVLEGESGAEGDDKDGPAEDKSAGGPRFHGCRVTPHIPAA